MDLLDSERELHFPECRKFDAPDVTVDGARRAEVAFEGLRTLWFNTGTLCNLACLNCYIESSPRNDALVYLSRGEVRRYLDEAQTLVPRPVEIGFTGGEPFMNPDIAGMIEDSLSAGFKVLVLTNAMKPMHRFKAALSALDRRFPGRLSLRVSLDSFRREGHEELRGPRSWEPAIAGLVWLARNGFDMSIAGRTVWRETEAQARQGYRALFARLNLPIGANDPEWLVLFPEMDGSDDVPEITEQCWNILGKNPSAIMCAHSRMVVKRKGARTPHVVSCTLLPHDPGFAMGETLAEASRAVKLNHPHCARFCVLGGASCSGAT